MRGLLLALLLGNVVYFVWQLVGYRHQQAVVYQTDAAEESLLNGERLVLISEREQAAAQPIEPVVIESPKPDAATTAVPVSTSPIVTAIEIEPAALPETQAPNPELLPPPTAATTEQLTEDELVAALQSNEAMVERDQCLYLGAFAVAEQRQSYSQRLQAVGIQAQTIELEVPGAVDYWVHIKPFVNRQQALTQLRELQSKQIDSFIIPQGPFQNGISLGVFDKRENAEKRRQEIAAKGYSAEIGKNQKLLKELWLMLDHQNSTKFSHSLYGALKKDFSLVEIKKDACKGVAR